MATAGKKGKKAKGKTVSLNDFLSVGSTEDGKVVVAAPTSWADEMDEYDEQPSFRAEQFVLPTAPRAARGPDVSDDRIPSNPPYTAYVANLSYDIDEGDVVKFFSKLKIKSVRLPREGDAETGRLKGFGYADFEDRNSLVEALSMNDLLLKNRKVRIDLATHAGRGDQQGGGGRDGGRHHRDEGDDRTAGDWRSGPAPSRDDDRRDNRYEPARDRDDRRDDRRDNRGYGFERRDDRDRGFDRDRRDDRGGFDRERRDGGGGGRGGFDRYERNDRGGDRFERRGGFERRSPEREAPRERPKLQLSKRSAEAEKEAQQAAAASSSIFGGARPVDTTRREKEIEEKLKKPEPRQQHKDDQPQQPDVQEELARHDSEDEKPKPKSSAASIFGQAKPVDTTAREKEIEERLRKKSEEKDADPQNGERRKIVLERGGETHQEKEIHSGDRHDRRGGPRGHHDDDRHAGPRRDGPRDRDFRDNRDHRDNRDRDGPRRNDREVSRGGGGPKRDQHDRKHDRSTPPPKKFEEKPAPAFAVANKFSYLVDSEEVGSGQDSE